MEFVNDFLAICGGISIIGGAAAVIWKWAHPAITLNKRIETLEEHAKNDYKAINDIQEMQSALCQAMVALIDHEITGNQIEGLKKTKTELIKAITKC